VSGFAYLENELIKRPLFFKNDMNRDSIEYTAFERVLQSLKIPVFL